MEGLLKFAGVFILLYLFGWLGKKNNRMVESWFDNVEGLFKRRKRENRVRNSPSPGEQSKLQKAFSDPRDFDLFLKDFSISPREWEVIELVCDGYTNKEIEDKIYSSLATVKDHLHKIFRKAGVKNRVQLTNFIRNTIDEANRKRQ